MRSHGEVVGPEGLAAFAEETQVGYTTKDYNLKNFSGISISGVGTVNLKKSDDWKVSVTLPEDMLEFLSVEVRGNDLVIGLKNVTLKKQKNLREWKVTADISMPLLASLEMTGATKFYCGDSFDLGERTFSMELSGASKASGINVTAKRLDLEMGGATSADITGVFDYAEIEMGGASRCDLNISALTLDQELTGAAKAYYKGDFNTVNLDASGAGVFSIKGLVKKMKAEASGAVKVETFDAEVDNASISFSGAAYGEINALNSLKVEMSGGASVRYRDNEGLKVDVVSMGRGASLRRVAKD